MEFLGLHIVGAAALLVVGWFLGRKWTDYNSVSDIENVFKDTVSKFEALKTKVADEAKAAQDKAEALKALIK